MVRLDVHLEKMSKKAEFNSHNLKSVHFIRIFLHCVSTHVSEDNNSHYKPKVPAQVPDQSLSFQ